ncbi:sulfurtransferase TusA [Buchnera aphidicola]|uniref:Sulfurtransferase TusA n=1 Tax=Buchnera aphidicola (Anoecia oenotherae) TaxID=1241833 RepID=A0A4D6XQ10_9GAMM|nr:sulfurtransferase TusA [Buchnera aphidicola]QCI19462.1 sulfurtransferase TusA [Buchnera aphidicola (Anoecia oenotherae)]
MKKIFEKKRNILDLRGLYCPDVVSSLRKTMRNIKNGDIILVISDDISIKQDIQYFCNFMGHNILDYHDKYIPFRYLLKRGSSTIT